MAKKTIDIIADWRYTSYITIEEREMSEERISYVEKELAEGIVRMFREKELTFHIAENVLCEAKTQLRHERIAQRSTE